MPYESSTAVQICSANGPEVVVRTPALNRHCRGWFVRLPKGSRGPKTVWFGADEIVARTRYAEWRQTWIRAQTKRNVRTTKKPSRCRLRPQESVIPRAGEHPATIRQVSTLPDQAKFRYRSCLTAGSTAGKDQAQSSLPPMTRPLPASESQRASPGPSETWATPLSSGRTCSGGAPIPLRLNGIRPPHRVETACHKVVVLVSGKLAA